MIIETLTAFTSVKIVLETLEIFHMVHVGHITGKAGYKGGNIIKRAIQQQQLKWQDKKYPALKLEREAETLYDFEDTGNAAQAISDINNEARDYLSRLKDSVNNLKKAKDYFVAIHTNLTELVNALTDRENCQFLSQLLEFKSSLESFKDEYNQFLLSIEPPPRQVLYIADMLSGSQVIEQYNDRLKTIETYTDLLEETKQKIIDQLNKGEEAKQEIIEQLTKDSNIVFTLSSTNSRIPPFEQLQRDIKQCINNPNQLSETMNAILPDNAKLAVICTDITLISLAFKQTHKQDQAVMQIRELKNNPNWFRLLTEAEQIEVGQRIVLHAMNEANHPEEKKLNLAKIFLQKHVSKYLINQIEISQFSYEMACVLRSWQIKKCEQMIQFLSRLTQGGVLPNVDVDGLLEWLKTKRKIQNSTAFFTEVLISPCCFKHRSIESALANFKSLAPDESIKIIQQHLDSHWGAIWDENDTLIQLPKSFDSIILPKHRRELENQFQNPNVVSPVMYKLAQGLIVDLQQLKIKLENNLTHHLDVMLSSFTNKLQEASDTQKNQLHQAGVFRIKKAYLYIPAITSPSNSLYPYLYQAETINEAEKKQQVPTQDDLLHLIYRGVDPNGVCDWKSSSSQPYSQSNQLLYYFFPNSQNDSRMQAWIYACRDCQVSAIPMLSHLFSPNERPLALGNTPEKNTSKVQADIKNSLSIQAILRDPTEVTSIAIHSKALNGVAPKTAQETETVLHELANYFMIALVRVNPEYRNELPLKKQFECLVKNFFKFGEKIGEERLESVQLYIGDLCAVLSAEDVNAINKGLDDLKINHLNRFEQAQKVDSSILYSIMKKAFDGPISNIINKINEVHQMEYREEETKSERIVGTLQENLEGVKQENEVLKTELEKTKDQLKESEAQRERDKEAMEAQRERDKEAMEAQRERDKADSEARLKELEEKFEARLDKLYALSAQQQTSTHPDTNIPETSNNTFLFRR
ncbi:MAG TPA: hypothetical protein VGH95_04030 [Candidatus Aquirickettsiella sp.]|jgi:hypothetical protein